MSGDANKVVTASYDRTVKVNLNLLLLLDFSPPTGHIMYFIDLVLHNSKYVFPICYLLKVALSQKILENFYISNINIPNHYPEQEIWISRLKQ